MAWARKRKRSVFAGLVLAVLFLTSIYACVRQAKSEPVAAKASAKAAPLVATQAEAPAQAQEKELAINQQLSADESLLAPLPVTGLREFENPRNLPTPGPPYNDENSNPAIVMRNIPKEATGVEDWVKAFKQEIIHPHESLDLDKKHVPPLKFDVEIPAMGSMPNVIFPHEPHTFWLDCTNCHPGIFMMKKGGNPISMVKIVNGEFCGRCHGRVAFPLANCTRCHVKPKE